jgi:hypothetical protein
MSDNLSFAATVRTLVPPWLSDRYPRPLVNGFSLLYCWGLALDSMMQLAVEGLRARLPSHPDSTPTALPFTGSDRRIIRGPDETDEHYASRLIPWLDTWRGAGSAITVLEQLAELFSPQAAPLMRIVTNQGTWYTYHPVVISGPHVTIEQRGNWNWDGRADLWARCWVIIYSSAGYPWSPDGTWGDGHRWGDGRVWGLTATRAQVVTAQHILAQWKAAHTLYPNIIVAFDPASFNPASPEPDGTWGKSYKVVGGHVVRSRLATARYLDGAA